MESYVFHLIVGCCRFEFEQDYVQNRHDRNSFVEYQARRLLLQIFRRSTRLRSFVYCSCL